MCFAVHYNIFVLMVMCPERGWDGGGKSSEEVTVGQKGWSLARMRAGMRERDGSFGDAF